MIVRGVCLVQSKETEILGNNISKRNCNAFCRKNTIAILQLEFIVFLAEALPQEEHVAIVTIAEVWLPQHVLLHR